ncbi:MAG: outer membrane lipoprotein-sorting protein, partial [Gammaproteobacteria bacterium]|nr:outer membrane lipoprotein-sorting protein [Gammaproteobacteria bacterium]NNF67351.1 outer membrane lipoprotein-sorting protein [Gammaproteobacteria bacterium]
YDRKEALLKTLEFSGFERYVDQFWRASVLQMTNHQTGKSTTLKIADFVFGNGFSDKDFNRNSLSKAR